MSAVLWFLASVVLLAVGIALLEQVTHTTLGDLLTPPPVIREPTTPVLRLADHAVAEGLGVRPMDPGPTHWVELPEDSDLWLDAVAR